MIVDGILMLIIGLGQALFDLLPEWDMRDVVYGAMGTGGWTPIGGWSPAEGNMSSVVNYAYATLWQMDNFIPVSDVVSMITITATVFLGVLLYKGARWVFGMLRGAAGS